MSLYGPGNLPYGVFGDEKSGGKICVRLGDEVIDLSGLGGLFAHPTLNPLLAAGRSQWTAARAAARAAIDTEPRHALADVSLRLPFEVADYTDFYSSEHHALNAGRILRPQGGGLTPQWKHLPIGYHGRSATVVVSGTPVERPYGQIAEGVHGPTQKLDIEAEVGFVVGTPGRRIATRDFAEHVFGVVLVNDWSARDLQAWEYVPLGPFLGKSFATSVSPWVVPLDALAPIAAPAQDPVPLDYLLPAGPHYDLQLAVDWNDTRVSEPPYATNYWTAAQQLAHLTSNGATVRTGDLYASGTVSGPRRDQAGSLLELTWNGTEPIKLDDGTTRGYLLDGDRITISATATGADGTTVGLGEVTGLITG